MDLQKFMQSWEEAIDGLDISQLTADTTLNNIPQWDSLAVLTTIAMADAEFDVSIAGQELLKCKTVGDVYQLIANSA